MIKIMKKYNFKFLTRTILILLFTSILLRLDAQIVEKAYDTKREEVQRYFGYELLLYRYLSIPYDASVNTNQSGNFVEIGFLYIIFLPIILLLLFRKTRYFWLLLFYLIFLWIISTSNSFVFSHKLAKVNTTEVELNNYLDKVGFNSEPLDIVVGNFHLFSRSVYKPLESIGNLISGDKDYFTYPFIILTFLIFTSLLVIFTRKLNQPNRIFLSFTWCYLFYWLSFGGGIVWYGYILLPSLYIVIILLLDLLKKDSYKIYKFLLNSFIITGLFWILIASVDRVSNIHPNIPSDKLGQGIFNPTFFDYACRKIPYEVAVQKMYPNLQESLVQINSEKESLIWRVGTSMTYFIGNNSKRVFSDNQMGMFNALLINHPNKSEVVEIAKASGFKYLILDLQTASIDQTPNKTLTKKYNDLIEFTRNNPKLKILSTDRVLTRMKGGKQENYYGFSGDQIYYNGRYAIFEFI